MARQTRFAATYLLEADLAVITGALDLSGFPGTLHVWSQAVFDSNAEWMPPHLTEGIEISGLMEKTGIRAVWQIHREIWRMRLDQKTGIWAGGGKKMAQKFLSDPGLGPGGCPGRLAPGRRPEDQLSCLIGATGEINLLSALVAFMGFVELVGEDLFDGIALGAIAGKGFQFFKMFKAWAVLGCAHGFLLMD